MATVMKKETRLQTALKNYKPISSVEHLEALGYLDQRVYMKDAGIEERAQVMGDIAVIYQKMMLDIAPQIKYLKGRNTIEKGILKEFRAQLVYHQKVPLELTFKVNKLASEAERVWRTARKKSDFKILQPYLEKNVEMHRQIAEHLTYESHPYDAMVDLFEFGMRVKQADPIFAKLLPALKRIKNKTDMPTSHRLESLNYSKGAMKRLTKELEQVLKISSKAFRSDVSEHPFMVMLSTKDVRITTTFQKRDFKNSLFDSLHEFGHAIYAFQLDPRLKYTPAEGSASFGIDESQSRLWENVIGHSMSFVKVLQPLLKKHFNINESDEEIYNYFNMLKTGAVIRTSANELDYDAHIAIRYYIERDLMEGSLEVSELPQVWNEYMKKYVGIEATNDRDGILQDPHWTEAQAFGYFPTYTLGNMISGMIWKEIGNFDQLVEEKKFDYIRKWLAENIHAYGSIYDPKDLLEKVFRKTYDTDAYIEYLEKKYLQRN